MRITKKAAVQVHPVPDRVMDPVGPFPPHLFKEPDIVVDYSSKNGDDGGDIPLGGTVQNNYRPPRYMRCAACLARVLEQDTENHVCGE